MLRTTLLLALILAGVPVTQAADVFFVPVELKAKRIPTVGKTTDLEIPPCTPLRSDAGDGGKHAELRHYYWGRVVVRRAVLDKTERESDLAACIRTAAAFAGRFSEDDITALLDHRLTVGMPSEFATLLLGPGFTTARYPGEDDRLVHSWIRGKPAGTCPQPPEPVQALALDELRPGQVVVGSSLANGQIADLAVPGAPRGLEDKIAYDAGMAIYESGDAAGAIETWLPLARNGMAPAAYSIADLYYRGDGVERRLEESIKWFRVAADELYSPAMFHLGFLYVQGEGVERNLAEAYRWMARAALLGEAKAEAGVKLLNESMTPEQLEDARRLMEAGRIDNPKLVHHVNPEFPELPRVARLEGNVILQVLILEDGTIGDAEVLRSSRPSMGFEAAAMAAVCQWRYEPARRGDHPLPVYTTVFVEFKLH